MISPDGLIEATPLKIRIWLFQGILIGGGCLLVACRENISLRPRYLFVIVIGFSCIAFGILLNEWIIARLLGLYGDQTKIAVWISEVILIVIGVCLIVYRNSPLALNIILLGISSVLSIAFFEGTLRLTVSLPILEVGTLNSPKAQFYGWALPPKKILQFINPDDGKIVHFTTNSQGWKDEEHHVNKPEGVFRILFLGDSVTYGIVPLEEIYTRQVEGLLIQQGKNVEVISMGVGGWGTDQSLEALIREGLSYTPDIVIYQFCGNDIFDILPPPEEIPPSITYWKKPFRYDEMSDDKLRKVMLAIENDFEDSEPFSQKAKKVLARSPILYYLNASKNLIVNTIYGTKYGKYSSSYEALKTEHWWDFYVIDPTSPYYLYHPDGSSPELKEAWRLLEALIIKMKTVTEKKGAKFLVFSEESDEGKRLWNISGNDFRQMGYLIISFGMQLPIRLIGNAL